MRHARIPRIETGKEDIRWEYNRRVAILFPMGRPAVDGVWPCRATPAARGAVCALETGVRM